MLSPSVRKEWPFEPSWFSHRDGRLHYVDAGPRDGPVLLCLHGNPSWSFLFRHLLRELQDGFRVVALDHLGCGLSEKPPAGPYGLQAHIDRAEALIAHLGLDRFSLAVHDWGGAIGMGVATRRPDAVQSSSSRTLRPSCPTASRGRSRSVGREASARS
ncbi:MAG: alpha/beta fold hydrolase [Myxococcales bacterium]|nr:alpha/beta fold hydrolase [Myxococcales bacterium]